MRPFMQRHGQRCTREGQALVTGLDARARSAYSLPLRGYYSSTLTRVRDHLILPNSSRDQAFAPRNSCDGLCCLQASNFPMPSTVSVAGSGRVDAALSLEERLRVNVAEMLKRRESQLQYLRKEYAAISKLLRKHYSHSKSLPRLSCRIPTSKSWRQRNETL